MGLRALLKGPTAVWILQGFRSPVEYVSQSHRNSELTGSRRVGAAITAGLTVRFLRLTRRQSVPFGMEEMAQFGDGSRELLVKASCYSLIAMELENAGPTISWVFSSEPKSVSFSVVYREGAHCPLEHAKVREGGGEGERDRGRERERGREIRTVALCIMFQVYVLIYCSS